MRSYARNPPVHSTARVEPLKRLRIFRGERSITISALQHACPFDSVEGLPPRHSSSRNSPTMSLRGPLQSICSPHIAIYEHRLKACIGLGGQPPRQHTTRGVINKVDVVVYKSEKHTSFENVLALVEIIDMDDNREAGGTTQQNRCFDGHHESRAPFLIRTTMLYSMLSGSEVRWLLTHMPQTSEAKRRRTTSTNIFRCGRLSVDGIREVIPRGHR
ncbi:hypothetical protein VNO77_02493 [Canavalia gladiata]|uniref:Uncharacterized protein n=1 Tax=Canavalia gladiata TaxID=3824 RepID=A0AAN9MTW2_CANGL